MSEHTPIRMEIIPAALAFPSSTRSGIVMESYLGKSENEVFCSFSRQTRNDHWKRKSIFSAVLTGEMMGSWYWIFFCAFPWRQKLVLATRMFSRITLADDAHFLIFSFFNNFVTKGLKKPIFYATTITEKERKKKKKGEEHATSHASFPRACSLTLNLHNLRWEHCILRRALKSVSELNSEANRSDGKNNHYTNLVLNLPRFRALSFQQFTINSVSK